MNSSLANQPRPEEKTLFSTPKRNLLEQKIFTSVELPLLVDALNESRMNSKGDCPEFQTYINSRKSKLIFLLFKT